MHSEADAPCTSMKPAAVQEASGLPSKEMVVIQNADHAIGGDVGGFPEQGLTAYGDIMMSFLKTKHPDV